MRNGLSGVIRCQRKDCLQAITHREVWGEALTGATGGPAIEPRNQEIGIPMLLSEAESDTGHDVNRKSCSDPARSKTLSTPGSFLHGSPEISSVPEPRGADGTGRAKSRNPVVHAGEKLDTPVVPKKPPNNGDNPAQLVEEGGVAKGNVNKTPTSRTQSRTSCASMGLEGVRVVARRDKTVRPCSLYQFNAMLSLRR